MSAGSEIIRDASYVGGSALGLLIFSKAVQASIVGVEPQTKAYRTHFKRAIRNHDNWITGKKAGSFYEVVGPGNYFKTGGIRNYRNVSEQAVVTNLEDFALPKKRVHHIVRPALGWGVVIDPRTDEMDHEAGYRFLFNAKDEPSLITGVTSIG